MSAVLLLPAYAETDLPGWASPGCPSVLLPVVWLNPVVSCVRLCALPGPVTPTATMRADAPGRALCP